MDEKGTQDIPLLVSADAQPASAPRLTLRKSERLHHTPLVNLLFDKGQSTYAYPLRVFYLLLDRESLDRTFHSHTPPGMKPLQMMITVPKKKFRHATDRVLLRRRIREAYRLHRHKLARELDLKAPGKTLLLAFIYIDSQERSYASIEKKMLKLFDKLIPTLTPAQAHDSSAVHTS